jgi:hypothetical protein
MAHFIIQEIETKIKTNEETKRVDKICPIVVKFVKIKDEYKLFIALHKFSDNTYGAMIRQIDPRIQDVRFHSKTSLKDHSPLEDMDKLFSSLSLSSISNSSHGYGTMCMSLEIDYGLHVIQDLISDSFNSTLTIDDTNIWIHSMYLRAKDTSAQGLIYVPLLNIISTESHLGVESNLAIESLDCNGKKILCSIDPMTVRLIKHIYSTGSLSWKSDPKKWL